MKNNKIRYKSMKRSSPFTQYRRYLLGKHYCYGYKTDNIFPMPIPTRIRERIAEIWDEYGEIWSHVGSVTLEREQHEAIRTTKHSLQSCICNTSKWHDKTI